jgi:hypothetical protein
MPFGQCRQRRLVEYALRRLEQRRLLEADVVAQGLRECGQVSGLALGDEGTQLAMLLER